MTWLILPATIASLSFALFHLIGAEVFAGWLRRQSSATPRPGASERLAILVASRGFDPSLPEMLRGLLEQSHPNYEVHVTVDESDGPAREKLFQIVEDRQVGLLARYQLDQMHIARRIEKMCTAEIFPEVIASSFSH